MKLLNTQRRPCKVLVIADCDFQDKPLGGVVSLLRNMLAAQSACLIDFSLVGIGFDTNEIEGVWQRKMIGGKLYRWLPAYVCDKTKDDTKFPLRFRLVAGVRRHLQAIALEDFDAVYIHSAETILALPSRDIPIVCHVHCDPLITVIRSRFHLLRSKVFVRQYNKVIRMAFDRAAGIIWAAEACRSEYYLRLGVEEVPRWDGKATVIHSSVDPVMLAELRCVAPHVRSDTKHIVTVSRLSEVKHIDFLISVFAELKKIYVNIDFSIAGEGECEQNLRNIVDSLGCSESIHFLGNLNKPELARLLAGMDVFVFASESEAMSLVVLESMAAGVPVVSTRVGDIDKVVTKCTGAIVEERDLKAFSEAVICCLEKGKDTYRDECVATARQFTAERMRRKIEEFIEQCTR